MPDNVATIRCMISQQASALQELLSSRAEDVATAESLTGGLLADRFTDIPGSSHVFVGGVVAYASSVKTDVLGVPHQVIEHPGVVSADCAVAMAEGVRRLLGSTYGLSTTGEAGPVPAGQDPVGRVWIGVAGPEGSQAHEVDCSGAGDRRGIREAAADGALSVLWGMLRGEEPDLG